MSQQQEYDLQVTIADYLRMAHPHVLFRSDMGGVRLSIGTAKKVKRIQKNRAFPDLFVFEQIGDFGGLFIELKIGEDQYFTKARDRLINGKATHLLEQCSVLMRLREKGYAADMVFSYEEAVECISLYLDGKYTKTPTIPVVVSKITQDQWLRARSQSPVPLDILEGMLVF